MNEIQPQVSDLGLLYFVLPDFCSVNGLAFDMF